MIKEFAGRKFRTRDGKYEADIVTSDGLSPYLYEAVLTSIPHERNETYTRELSFIDSSSESAFDLIEVVKKKYDWPMWTVVKVWDGDETTDAVWAHPFAGTNRNGYPMTFNYYSNKRGMWEKMAWKHAELIDTEKEGTE